MQDLSLNARIVLGSCFAWGNAHVLTYRMLDSIPSPEMQDALNELVQAGMLVEERGLLDMTENAVRYLLAESVDVTPFREEAWKRMEEGSMPSIRILIPKGSV